MNILKEKKIAIPLLIIACLLVWSRNIYLLFTDADIEEENLYEMEIDTALLINDVDASLQTDAPKYVYSSQYRDPFKSWFSMQEQKPPEQPKQKPVRRIKKSKPIPPRLRYCGIIRDDSGTLAILEDPAGKIHYINRGDTISQVYIINITEDSLHCQWDTTSYKIPLQY